MPDNGARAISPAAVTLGTALADIATVPVGKNWTILLATACNVRTPAGDVTVSMQVVTPGGATAYVAFNAPVKAGTRGNAFGPDPLGPLPAGTKIRARGSEANAIDFLMTGVERDVA